ncbi:hypothetical protein M0R04_08130 [Candidatus Dojkabacteria bacterium]|jgi:hypothetical protein|nr:hypothetical protein [Candidatus Dojkabacteria bacterium]
MFDKLKSRFGSGSSFAANTYIRITQEGTDALAKEEISSAKQVSILDVLQEHSPQTIHSVSKGTGISINDTMTEITKLRSGKMVQLVED